MLSGVPVFDRECSRFFWVKISAPLSSKSEKRMYLCEVPCCFTFYLLKSIRTTHYTVKFKQQAANIAHKSLGTSPDAFVPRHVHFVGSCRFQDISIHVCQVFCFPQ